MAQLSITAKATTLTVLSLLIIFIFTRKRKQWDYERTKSIDYNKAYNEKHPVIDTIEPYYKNTNPILVRSGFKIQGHDKIGVVTGGAQLWFECSDDCGKCNKK